MNTDLIKSYSNYSKVIDIKQTEKLLSIGALCERTMLYFVLKSEYFDMQKNSDASGRSTIIYLSIKWNVSETTIKNILYKMPKIK